MNNLPPLSERWIVEEDGRGGKGLAKMTEGWSNWFTQVFLGLPWKKGFNIVATVDFGSATAQGQSTATVTITGARSGDSVQVTPTSDLSGIVFTGVVTSNDTVTVYAKNFSSGAIDPASQVFRIIVLQN